MKIVKPKVLLFVVAKKAYASVIETKSFLSNSNKTRRTIIIFEVNNKNRLTTSVKSSTKTCDGKFLIRLKLLKDFSFIDLFNLSLTLFTMNFKQMLKKLVGKAYNLFPYSDLVLLHVPGGFIAAAASDLFTDSYVHMFRSGVHVGALKEAWDFGRTKELNTENLLDFSATVVGGLLYIVLKLITS